MPLDIKAVQRALNEDRLDGWLLYDFHGSNPIAVNVAGLAGSPKMATRRWYYLIPAHGEPRALVHAIERYTLDALPGRKLIYSRRAQLESGLGELLGDVRRVAMEYSPDCNIPYLSRVDAGAVELIRKAGADVVSSGDLVQRFEAVWDEGALVSHRAASERLYRIKDRAFDAIATRLLEGRRTTEFDIQQLMVDSFEAEGLISDSAPVVAAQENAGNPHYQPNAKTHRVIGADEIIVLDLWGKLPESGAVFADITWVGYTGSAVPAEYARPFAAARDGRDAAILLVEDAMRAGRDLRGWQVDRAARDVIEQAGFGSQFIHRTGHSLGENVHGNGVHMDDYETHDERRLIPGTGFTIEPGIYSDKFGVRTEINMYIGERDASVTGPRQTEIVPLAARVAARTARGSHRADFARRGGE